MDPIKAQALERTVTAYETRLAQLEASERQFIEEFGALWGQLHDLHVRLCYVMTKIQLNRDVPSILVGVPAKVVRVPLTELFEIEREAFLAQLAEVERHADSIPTSADPAPDVPQDEDDARRPRPTLVAP